MNKYSRIGYIARMQPAHIGHIETIRKALTLADEVLVMVGSAYQSPGVRNPFNYEQRVDIIRRCFNEKQNSKITIVPLADTTYLMEQWVAQVQALMEQPLMKEDEAPEDIEQYAHPKALIGFKKDHTSFYLNYFPQWDFIDMPNIESLHSTEIRDIMYGQDEKFARLLASEDNKTLPNGVKSFLREYFDTEEYQWMRSEYQYAKEYDPKDYDVGVTTADSVVVCAGHILLIKRKDFPGEGLWALPGGHVNIANERVHEAAERELIEETQIDVPPAILNSCYVDKDGRPRKDNHDYFDDVNRSARARVITHAWLVHLPPQTKGKNPGVLPKVTASDDAIAAKWIPLSEFAKMESQMFEDHFHIAQYFISRL